MVVWIVPHTLTLNKAYNTIKMTQ